MLYVKEMQFLAALPYGPSPTTLEAGTFKLGESIRSKHDLPCKERFSSMSLNVFKELILGSKTPTNERR
jgi:hypothetical protein